MRTTPTPHSLPLPRNASTALHTPLARRRLRGGVPILALALTLTCDAAAGASYLVDTLEDGSVAGRLSLRDAIAAANQHAGPDLIHFAPALFETADREIVLTAAGTTDTATGASAFAIDGDLTLVGPRGPHGLTLRVSGDSPMRHFLVRDAARLELRYLSLAGGHPTGDAAAGSGGAVAVHGGTFQAWGCYLAGNRSDTDARFTTGGGALYLATGSTHTSAATLASTTLYDNTSYFTGGAIYAAGGTLKITFSTIAYNGTLYANNQGLPGLVLEAGATLELDASIVSNRRNTAGVSNFTQEITGPRPSGRSNFVSEESGCLVRQSPPAYCAAADHRALLQWDAKVAAVPVRHGGPTPVLPAELNELYLVQIDVVNRSAPLCQHTREDQRGFPRPRASRNALLSSFEPGWTNGGCDVGAFELQGTSSDQWQDPIFQDAFEPPAY